MSRSPVSHVAEHSDERIQRASEAGAPAGVLGAFHRAETALRQTDIVERALKAGEPMPGFTLPDMQGRAVALAGLLARSTVAVRGDGATIARWNSQR